MCIWDWDQKYSQPIPEVLPGACLGFLLKMPSCTSQSNSGMDQKVIFGLGPEVLPGVILGLAQILDHRGVGVEGGGQGGGGMASFWL